VDRYLRIVTGDAVGIKLRQGRIEVKQRQRQFGVIRFHQGVAGLVEHWRKWSFPLAETDGTLSNLIHPAASWIGVQKSRQLRSYRLTDDQQVVAVSTRAALVQGCDLELTQVGVGERAWWSLALEAFGEESTLYENLLAVAQQVLTHDARPPLAAENSFGYPRWLTGIFPNG
jgi:hypothetical protein